MKQFVSKLHAIPETYCIPSLIIRAYENRWDGLHATLTEKWI